MRKSGSSKWTVSNYLTKTRLLLDQAVMLGMIDHNPARDVTISQPKTATERRILSQEEARKLLDLSLDHRQNMSGSLPIVVRLGLYAGDGCVTLLIMLSRPCTLQANAVGLKKPAQRIQLVLIFHSKE